VQGAILVRAGDLSQLASPMAAVNVAEEVSKLGLVELRWAFALEPESGTAFAESWGEIVAHYGFQVDMGFRSAGQSSDAVLPSEDPGTVACEASSQVSSQAPTSADQPCLGLACR
jgi:hypothetical protein